MPGYFDLSGSSLTIYRDLYAVCLAVQILVTVPGAKRFFCSERFGGYVATGKVRDLLYRPAIVYPAAILWLLCAVGLLFDRTALAASLGNVILCRFLLVGPRWNSLSRGFGAVGQITSWVGTAVLLLLFGNAVAGTTLLQPSIVAACRIDFGLIMIVAGIYKVTAGYVRNDGFQSALINPWWCYWSKLFKRLSPGNPVFAVMNHAAYAVEIAGGILMLTPLYEYGAIAICISFAMLGLQLRLTGLPWMVVATFFLFVAPHSALDNAMAAVLPTHAAALLTLPAWISFGLTAIVWAYIASIILVRAGLYYNFFAGARLPEFLQRATDQLSNHLLITIWRVFTANVINFYIDVAVIGADGRRHGYERVGLGSWRQGFRYAHAGEFVALCTTFTTLKYFPDRASLFEERLVRYARTVDAAPGSTILFTFVALRRAESFEEVPAAEFLCDPVSGKVTERTLASGFDIRAATEFSKIVRAGAPGSYAPARR